jgi:hypothetical protein
MIIKFLFCSVLLLAQANNINCEPETPKLTYFYEGNTSGYAENVMEGVITLRQDKKAYPFLPKILPDVDGYIAVLHCEHIGRIAYVTFGQTVLKTLVTDCAHPDSYDWMINTPYALEFDFELWQKYGSQWVKVEVEK